MGDHDDMLFSMLKDCKTLPMFLDSIFGFLRRRTDFYHIATEPNAVVGLPEGLAEQIVKHSFVKWKPGVNVVDESSIPVAGEEEVISEAFEASQINEVPEITKEKKISSQFTKSECYNGAMFDNYSWSQSINDIDVTVKLPQPITTKDLLVIINSNHITIKFKNGDIILDGDLCQKCKHNDAIWSIQKEKLEIHLEKCLDMWWDCFIKSEPKLDISKIDCSRPFEDLPEEAQAKIEELQWNQERKRMGLPSSEEIALQKTLQKAWNVEGSPFKGPFDPNAVTLINNGNPD